MLGRPLACRAAAATFGERGPFRGSLATHLENAVSFGVSHVKAVDVAIIRKTPRRRKQRDPRETREHAIIPDAE
jgi:hypothetical protein